jgi:hypothetical protein
VGISPFKVSHPSRVWFMVISGALIVITFGLSALIITGVPMWWRNQIAFGDTFRTIAKGDSRQSVIDKLGSGEPVECISLAWGGDESKRPNDGSCVSALQYFRFAMLYVVGFDKDGRAIMRYQGTSP